MFKILNKLLKKIRSILKIYYYKIYYRKNLLFKRINKIYIGKNSIIEIEGDKANVVIDSLRCRREFIINVNNGFLEIGKDNFFNNFCSINCREKIKIGNYCLFGEGVKIYDHDHIYYLDDRLVKDEGFINESIEIGDNVWIGSNTIILKGTKIGNNVVVGAGTIVKGTIESNTIIYNKREIKVLENRKNNTL